MNTIRKDPLLKEEDIKLKEEDIKKREFIKRTHPPALCKLKKIPTEKELAIDRRKPHTERIYYPFTWKPTHIIVYKTEEEIDAIINKDYSPRRQVLINSSKVRGIINKLLPLKKEPIKR